MTEPTDSPRKTSKGRMIFNIAFLALNAFISVYFLQNGQLILFLLFAVLAVRNAYIVYTEWRTLNE